MKGFDERYFLGNIDQAVFAAVNYGTPELIVPWVQSIKRLDQNAHIYLLDNFSTAYCRSKVKGFCKEMGVELLVSENVGYGRALNILISHIRKKYSKGEKANRVIYIGNLDIEYKELPKHIPMGNVAYILKATENRRDRNPFLTRLQKRFLFLHAASLKTRSLFIFQSIILIIKIISLFPSKPWTTHGSVFCFNFDALNDEDIFNEKTFLYSEELEYGSWLDRSPKTPLISISGHYEHQANVSTSMLISSKRDFFNLWRPSFENWLQGQ